MATLKIYDPAMCCSTGICGPSVDPALVRFAADLDWLTHQGASVERFNLAQAPAAFVADAEVKAALGQGPEKALPLIKVDGVVKSQGRYPVRAELAAWAGIEAPRFSPHAAEPKGKLQRGKAPRAAASPGATSSASSGCCDEDALGGSDCCGGAKARAKADCCAGSGSGTSGACC